MTGSKMIDDDGVRRRLVTIQQAMVQTGVSRRTIYNWLYAKRIEFVRTAGGTVRIFEDTLFRGPMDVR